jgi:hypothetical protein
MDFGSALKLLKSGEAVRRPFWSYRIRLVEQPGFRASNPDLSIPTLFLLKLGGFEDGFHWIPNDDDLLAEDWEA